LALDALGRKLEYHGKDLYVENLSITHCLGFCRTNPEDENPQKPVIGPSRQSGFPINIIREKYLGNFPGYLRSQLENGSGSRWLPVPAWRPYTVWQGKFRTI
jgi:hypothetical protein